MRIEQNVFFFDAFFVCFFGKMALFFMNSVIECSTFSWFCITRLINSRIPIWPLPEIVSIVLRWFSLTLLVRSRPSLTSRNTFHWLFLNFGFLRISFPPIVHTNVLRTFVRSIYAVTSYSLTYFSICFVVFCDILPVINEKGHVWLYLRGSIKWCSNKCLDWCQFKIHMQNYIFWWKNFLFLS